MGRLRALLVGVALVAGMGAQAQDLTDQQLLQLFERQREAFREARDSELGQTRGLKLITVENATASSGTELAASEATDLRPLVGPESLSSSRASTSGEGVRVSAATEGAGAAGEVAGGASQELVFGDLDPQLQVNLQVRFAFDSAVIDESQLPKLEQMCRVMKDSDVNLFRVVGHTDAAGSEAYNEQLSILRAREVVRYLVNDCGLSPTRLESVGLGERFLANPANPRADENRRVEFQALS